MLLVARASDSFSISPEHVALVELSSKASKAAGFGGIAPEKLGGVWTCQCAKNVGDKICPERKK